MESPGADHAPLPGAEAAKLYFDRFARIITHMREVTRSPDGKELGDLQRLQVNLVEVYLNRLASTFHALSIKHLMAGRAPSMPTTMSIDRIESGFPVYSEVVRLANDLRQAPERLPRIPKPSVLKERMISHILSELTPPSELQVEMSQRLYLEELLSREQFLPQNRPQLVALTANNSGVSAFMLHWATYDSATSLPLIYFMVLEDTARLRLDQNPNRFQQVQDKLLAQSLSTLKLLTIARGFDEDFDDLHPKFLRRIFIGPMYSHAFTEQNGPLREILAEVSGQPSADWLLSWTTETLVSARTETKSTGIFSKVQREVFDIDPSNPATADAGVTRMERSAILPLKPYQVLIDRDPPGMRDVRKYVIAENGNLLSGL